MKLSKVYFIAIMFCEKPTNTNINRPFIQTPTVATSLRQLIGNDAFMGGLVLIFTLLSFDSTKNNPLSLGHNALSLLCASTYIYALKMKQRARERETGRKREERTCRRWGGGGGEGEERVRKMDNIFFLVFMSCSLMHASPILLLSDFLGKEIEQELVSWEWLTKSLKATRRRNGQRSRRIVHFCLSLSACLFFFM